ncbi:MAG: hypothetical protein ACI4T9_01290 [Prevotella sp.]
MKAKIIIDYNIVDEMYYANSLELEPYHVLKTEGYDIAQCLERIVSNIEQEISMCERMLTRGVKSDMDDEDFNADEVLKALTGLQLYVEVSDSADDGDDDDTMYVNAANIMFTLQAKQKDKAGRDYIFHPMRVSEKCHLIEAKTVALLHDTVEDTKLTFDQLREYQFSEEIINGVAAVTRKEGESYADFIERASKDEIGHEVKINDLEDNMNITRLSNLTEKDWHRLNKYLHAWRYLTSLETTTENIKE